MPTETLDGTAELRAFQEYLGSVVQVEDYVAASFRTLPVLHHEAGGSLRTFANAAAPPMYNAQQSFRDNPTQTIQQGPELLQLDEDEFAQEDEVPQAGWSRVAELLTRKLRLELVLVAQGRNAPLQRTDVASGSFYSLVQLASRGQRANKLQEQLAAMPDDDYEAACIKADIRITAVFQTRSPEADFSGLSLITEYKLVAEFLWRHPGVKTLLLRSCKGFSKNAALVLAHAVCNNAVVKVDIAESDADVIFGAALAVAAFKSKTLQDVCMSRVKLGAAGAVFWGGLLKMQTSGGLVDLNLEQCGLGNDGVVGLVQGLGAHPTLKRLNLADNGIGRLGGIKLGEALSTNTCLEVLNLDDNDIGSRGATAVAHALQQPACKLNEVRLNNCGIGPNGGKALAVAIWENRCITKLLLKHNDLSDPGVGPFGPALLKNRSLVYLDLTDNDVTDLGATGLALGLGPDCALQTLVLTREVIKDAGAVAIANALAGNTRLVSLYLDENGIKDRGGVALAVMLARNCALRELRLQCNTIANEGATALGRVLVDKSNTTLELLDVSDNPISTRVSAELFAKAESRTVQGHEAHIDVVASGTKAARGNLVMFGVSFTKQEVPMLSGVAIALGTLLLNLYVAASHIEIMVINWIKALELNQGVSFYYPVFMTFFIAFTWVYICVVLSLPGKDSDATLPITEALTSGWTGGSQSLKAHLSAVRGAGWDSARVKITVANVLFCRQAYEAYLSWHYGYSTINYSSVSLVQSVFMSIPLGILQINLLLHVQNLDNVANLLQLNDVFSDQQTAITVMSVILTSVIVARTAADLFEKTFVVEWKRNAMANEQLAMVIGSTLAVAYHLVHFCMRAFIIALAAEILSSWLAFVFFTAMVLVRVAAWAAFHSERSWMFCFVCIFVGSASWDLRVLARLTHVVEVVEAGVVAGVLFIPAPVLATGFQSGYFSSGTVQVANILQPANIAIFLACCVAVSLVLYLSFIERIHDYTRDTRVQDAALHHRAALLARQPFADAKRERKRGVHNRLRQPHAYKQPSGVFTGFARQGSAFFPVAPRPTPRNLAVVATTMPSYEHEEDA